MSERLYGIMDVATGQLIDIARKYDLGAVRETRLCSPGLINSNYEVRTSKGSYLIRVYAAHRKREHIEFELSVLRYLSARGFPCQRPVHTRSGECIGSLGENLFGVFTFLPGEILEQDQLSDSLCRQMGKLYARMQRLLRGFAPDGAKPDAGYPLIKDQVAGIRSVFRDKGVPETERALFESLWSEVSPRFRETGRTVVHGDLHYGNVLCQGDRITGIIDFDDAFMGSPLLDLALVAMEFSAQKDNTIDFPMMSAFLEAYAEDGLPISITPEGLWNSSRFQCFKFLGYTIELTAEAGAAPTANEYFQRLIYLTEPTTRERFVDCVRQVLGTAA